MYLIVYVCAPVTVRLELPTRILRYAPSCVISVALDAPPDAVTDVTWIGYLRSWFLSKRRLSGISRMMPCFGVEPKSYAMVSTTSRVASSWTVRSTVM